MTIAIAIAIAVHAIPLLVVDPEDETVPVYEEVVYCNQGCWEEPPESFDEWEPYAPSTEATMQLTPGTDQRLSREQAVEQARIGGVGSFWIPDDIGYSGVLGNLYQPLTTPTKLPPITYDDGEIWLESVECDWCWFPYRERWRLREYPQLVAGMWSPAEPPTVVLSPITSAGPIDKAILRRYLKRHRLALASCYQEQPSLALGRHAHATGEVTLAAQLLIDGSGHVTQVNVAGGGEVRDCVRRTLAAIEFPRPADNAPTQVALPIRYGTTVMSAAVFVR